MLEHKTYSIGFSVDPVTGERGPLDESNPMVKLLKARIDRTMGIAAENVRRLDAERHEFYRSHIERVVSDWCWG